MHAFPNTELDINFEDKLDESELTSKTWNLRYNQWECQQGRGVTKGTEEPSGFRGCWRVQAAVTVFRTEKLFPNAAIPFLSFPNTMFK